MKRLVLSFAILTFLAACGGGESGDDMDGSGPAKPGKPRPGKPGSDAGASADAGTLSDGGVDGGNGDAGSAGDASIRDTGAPAETFDGHWSVTLKVNADTTCTNPSQYESQILDTWVFMGDVLTGDHLGPNPYAREPGADVWSSGAASIDLQLDSAGLHGTVYFDYGCDVFYDVVGIRPK